MELLAGIGSRARALRLVRGFSQDEVAARAGVGVATVRRFEQTGTASLDSLVRIAFALDADAAFQKLFEPPAFQTLDEALARPTKPRRMRAAKRR